MLALLATVGKLLAEQPPLMRHIPRIATLTPCVVPPAAVANDPTFNKEDLA